MKENAERPEFKDRLREALDVRNMKAIELSRRTSIPKGAISYYLAGRTQPKADRLYKIGVALDVEEAWLLGYDVPMDRSEEQKKSDVAVDITVKLGSDLVFRSVVKRNCYDPEFLELCSMLVELDADELERVKNVLHALLK